MMNVKLALMDGTYLIIQIDVYVIWNVIILVKLVLIEVIVNVLLVLLIEILLKSLVEILDCVDVLMEQQILISQNAEKERKVKDFLK